MDNGQIGNVMVSRGGRRCRHQWIPDVSGMLDEAPADPKEPAAFVVESSSMALKSALQAAVESAPVEIQKLAAKAGPVRIKRGKSPTYDPVAKTIAAPSLVSRENLLHEMAHHIDRSIGDVSVSTDRNTTIGEALFQERNRLGKMPSKALAQLAVDVQDSSIFVRDLACSARRSRIY